VKPIDHARRLLNPSGDLDAWRRPLTGAGHPPRVQTLVETDTPDHDAAVTEPVHRRLGAGYRIADWQ
jgi:hypothetical protein